LKLKIAWLNVLLDNTTIAIMEMYKINLPSLVPRGKIDFNIVSNLVGLESADMILNARVPTDPKRITPIRSKLDKAIERGISIFTFLLSLLDKREKDLLNKSR
jgi:hypothetical protein